MTFPDIDLVLQELLAPLVGGPEYIGTQTPERLQELPHFIRVGRVGGARTPLEDAPVTEIDFFARLRAEAQPGAERVSAFILGAPYHFVRMPDGSGALLEQPQQPVGPRELPWPAAGVRRFGGTYRFILRPS